jgi:hypothetical protein
VGTAESALALWGSTPSSPVVGDDRRACSRTVPVPAGVYRFSTNALVAVVPALPAGVNIPFAVSLIRLARLSRRLPAAVSLTLILAVVAAKELTLPDATSTRHYRVITTRRFDFRLGRLRRLGNREEA